MGIIRNAANRKIVGRIGDTTYYVSNQRQVARQALNSSNFGETARRSEKQQSNRVQWSNLVQFYKLSKGWMHKAYEGKKSNQSDYNRFMSVNRSRTTSALTRSEALQGACVAESYIISQGSLMPIEQTFTNRQITTNISVGSLSIGSSTTVGEFAAAIVAANQNIEYDMQLSFVSYQQTRGANGVPYVVLGVYEVTLTRDSTALLHDFLPPFCCDVLGSGFLGAVNLSVGMHSYVLSQSQVTGLKVSTQSLVGDNSEMIDYYKSEEQVQQAILSYGVDQDVMLAPNTIAAEPYVPAVFNIASVAASDGSNIKLPGVQCKAQAVFSDGRMNVNLLNELPAGAAVADATITFNSGSTSGAELHVVSATGKLIVLQMATGSWLQEDIITVSITLADGQQSKIEFA